MIFYFSIKCYLYVTSYNATMTDTPRDVKLHFGISSTLTHGHTWYPRSLHETRQLGRTKLYPVTAAPPRIQSHRAPQVQSTDSSLGYTTTFVLLLHCYCYWSYYYHSAIFLPAADHGSPDTLLSPKVEAFPLTTSQIRQVLLLKQPLEMGGDPT